MTAEVRKTGANASVSMARAHSSTSSNVRTRKGLRLSPGFLRMVVRVCGDKAGKGVSASIAA